MNQRRQELADTIARLGLAGEVTAIDEVASIRLYAEIEGRFSTAQGARWIWEHLRFSGASRHFDDDRAFTRLPTIVPERAESLLFFPRSDEVPVTSYRADVDAIVRVIGNSAAFEYCIVPIGLEWLVGENHHGVVYAIGEPVESRLRAIGEP